MSESEQKIAVELAATEWDVIIHALGEEADQLRGPELGKLSDPNNHDAKLLDDIGTKIVAQL